MPQPEEPMTPLEQLKKVLQQTVVSWGLPGSAVWVAVHFARQGQWVQAGLWFAAALLLAFVIKLFQRIDPRLDKLAEWLVSHGETAVLQAWWTLTDNFQGQYFQQLVYSYRDFRTQGLKTKGPFALDLEKVFVPLRVAPESLSQMTSAMIQDKEALESLEVWDFLARISSQSVFQRIAIIGPPGSGKSTLLEHLALTYAKGHQRRYHRNAPKLIPILLYLRDLQEDIIQDSPPDLGMLITQQTQTLNPSPHWFEDRLKQGRCLVMLDGLDEVADQEFRKQVSQWVDLQIQTYSKTAFLITSRPFGYRSAPLHRVGTVVEVKPFSLTQMQQFVENWYLQNEIMRRLGKDDPGVRAEAQRQADDLIYRIKNSPPLASMALNPLLLTMIATVHCYRGALPGRRVELYAEICDVLLGRRQEAKGIADKLTAVQKKSVLQVLALNRMTKKTREFKLITGMLLIREKLEAIAGDTANPEVFIQQIETVSGLLIERQPGVYEFVHKSFQEYLAAAQIKEKGQDWILSRHIDDLWWSETIRLYAAQSDASNLIWAALQCNNIVALTLAYDCLEEGLSVADREVRQELEHKLEAGLESNDAKLFRLAVEVRLARRLNSLLRIDEHTEIDQSHITCAEYQLFIDEQRQIGENRQPDHWHHDRFLPGEASQPIVGVRGQDSQAFCEWLTQRSTPLGALYLEQDREQDTPVFVGDFRIRLPFIQEVEAHPHPAKQLGCWSKRGKQRVVTDLEPLQWQIWTNQVRQLLLILGQALDDERALVSALNRDRAVAQDHALFLVRDRPLNLDRTLDLNANHDRVRDRTLALALARALELDRTQVLDRALGGNLDRALDRALALALARDRALARNLADDLARARALDRALDRALNRTLEPQPSSPAQIRDGLLLLFMLWHLLVEFYAGAAEQPKQRPKHLTKQACEHLSRKYAVHRDDVFELYVFFVLVDERSKQNIPAWEGIRIVREKIQPPAGAGVP